MNIIFHRGGDGTYMSMFGYSDTTAVLSTLIDGEPVTIIADRSKGIIIARVGEEEAVLESPRLAELVYLYSLYLSKLNANYAKDVEKTVKLLASIIMGYITLDEKIDKIEQELREKIEILSTQP